MRLTGPYQATGIGVESPSGESTDADKGRIDRGEWVEERINEASEVDEGWGQEEIPDKINARSQRWAFEAVGRDCRQQFFNGELR